MSSPSHTWIDRPEQLAPLAEQLERAAWLALDTEANSMFVYRERVCLIQINAEGRLYVLDPLALAGPDGPGATFDPLKPVLEDRARVKYLHGGDYDIGILKRDFGIELAGVWDSQQAAMFLGWERTGYAAVVERVCGVKLEKAYTGYDWGTRPLDPNALAYALDDVVYLPQACERMREMVRAADLEEEVEIANRSVEAATWTGGYDPAAIWRMQGVRGLSPRAMGVLCAIHDWRNAVAAQVDRPAGQLVNSRVLVALANALPDNLRELKRHGLRASLAATHGKQLLGVIRQAAEVAPALPDAPERREIDPAEREREARLRDWRRAEAERRKVPMQVVLPARALEHLKRHGAADLDSVPQLGAKRVRLYGEQLRALCAVR
ncbi:MAG: ribonuclease D [Myxococcales bacterium]